MPGCWRGQRELTLVKGSRDARMLERTVRTYPGEGSRDARMLERTVRTYPGEGVKGCEDVGEDSENLPW